VQPSTANPGSEVSLYLNQPAYTTVVSLNDRPLPKKTSPDGKVIVVPVPGGIQTGSYYFKLNYNGQVYQSDNTLTVTAPQTPYSTEQSVDWSNIPGLVLHLFRNDGSDVELSLMPVPTKKNNLHVFGAFDEGAETGAGFCWWEIINFKALPQDYFLGWENTSEAKLPGGLCLGLRHSLQENEWNNYYDTVCGYSATTTSRFAMPFNLWKEDGGDEGGSVHEGFYWWETVSNGNGNGETIIGNNAPFTKWDEAENNLPKGTVLCLKHSKHQPKKTVEWRGIVYDPVKSYREQAPSPPTFIPRYEGDIGADTDHGEGFYWYEKMTGPEFFQYGYTDLPRLIRGVL
jgi:hypothetical protein